MVSDNQDNSSGLTDFQHHRFPALDGMRGIAAILVMLYHYYRAYNFSCLSNSFIAVDFFFILSGFVLSHSYSQKLLNGMSSVDYIVRRIARLFPMMAIGLFAGIVSFYFLNAPGDFSRREVIASMAMNLFFIPYLNHKMTFSSAIGNIFPVDPPLWSIFFEVIASIFFVWLVKLQTRRLGALAFLSYALLCAACLIGGLVGYNHRLGDPGGFETDNFLSGFPRVSYGFTCGMILYRLRAASSRQRLLNWPQQLPALPPLCLYLGLALMLLCPVQLFGFYYLLAIAFLAPLLVMQGGKSACRNSALLLFSKRLGWLSYPIYCLHVPVFLGVRALATRDMVIHKAPLEIVAIATTLILATLSAVLMDKYGHKRFQDLLKRAAGIAMSNPNPDGGGSF